MLGGRKLLHFHKTKGYINLFLENKISVNERENIEHIHRQKSNNYRLTFSCKFLLNF